MSICSFIQDSRCIIMAYFVAVKNFIVVNLSCPKIYFQMSCTINEPHHKSDKHIVLKTILGYNNGDIWHGVLYKKAIKMQSSSLYFISAFAIHMYMAKTFYANIAFVAIGTLYLLFGPRQLCKYDWDNISFAGWHLLYQSSNYATKWSFITLLQLQRRYTLKV